MAGGRAGHPREAVEADAAATEGILDKAPMGVVPDLADEVSGVVKAAAAAGLVGALAARERLPGAGGDCLALKGEAVDLDVDVGVGGAHDHHRLRRRDGDGAGGGRGGEGGKGEAGWDGTFGGGVRALGVPPLAAALLPRGRRKEGASS